MKKQTDNASPFQAKADKIFSRYAASEIFFTSDGTGFLDQEQALLHSNNLKDKQITNIKKQSNAPTC